MSDYSVEYWLAPWEIDMLSYSGYWNDEEQEKSKEFNILDGNFNKMEQYIDALGLYKDLEACVNSLEKDFNLTLQGVGVDLGAGNLWGASKLLSAGKWDITKLYCLEYSKHRLLKIGPKVLEHYRISSDKVVLILGSFYDLKLKNSSVDFILLSAAFHHADDPDRLLNEIKRVLKPRGVVIIIGEHVCGLRNCVANICNNYLKHMAKFCLTRFTPAALQLRLFHKAFNMQTFLPKFKTFFPPDIVLGDHLYTSREYKMIFSKHNFKFKHLRRKGSKYCSYILALN